MSDVKPHRSSQSHRSEERKSTEDRERHKRYRSRERRSGRTSHDRVKGEIPTREDLAALKNRKFLGRCRLFIGNLPASLKDSEMKELFTQYGEVSECFCSSDKGFGFVRMDTRAHAEAAKEALDGFELKGRAIRVRFAVHVAAIRVKEIPPFASNEILQQAFSMFGEVERAVHFADEKGRPVGEGIVEFSRRPGAQDAIKRITDGVYMLTANPKPIVVEAIDARDEEDGVMDRLIPKSALCQREREVPPRFATPGSFEHQFGMRWKALYNEEKLRKEQLEDEFRERRRHLENEMDLAHQEYQTSLIREDLRRRQEELERLERETKEKMELARRYEEERLERARQLLTQPTGSGGYQKYGGGDSGYQPAFVSNSDGNYFASEDPFARDSRKFAKTFGDVHSGSNVAPFLADNYRLLQPSVTSNGSDFYAASTNVSGFDSSNRAMRGDAGYNRAEFPRYDNANESNRRNGRDDVSASKRRRR